jgi:hypothetical protein
MATALLAKSLTGDGGRVAAKSAPATATALLRNR